VRRGRCRRCGRQGPHARPAIVARHHRSRLGGRRMPRRAEPLQDQGRDEDPWQLPPEARTQRRRGAATAGHGWPGCSARLQAEQPEGGDLGMDGQAMRAEQVQLRGDDQVVEAAAGQQMHHPLGDRPQTRQAAQRHEEQASGAQQEDGLAEQMGVGGAAGTGHGARPGRGQGRKERHGADQCRDQGQRCGEPIGGMSGSVGAGAAEEGEQPADAGHGERRAQIGPAPGNDGQEAGHDEQDTAQPAPAARGWGRRARTADLPIHGAYRHRRAAVTSRCRAAGAAAGAPPAPCPARPARPRG
jgi:hypothetical protein